jgi:hypothetical protein
MLKIKLPTAKATEGGPQVDKRRRSAAGAGRAESVEVCALCRSAAALALLPSRGRRLRRRACPMATKFTVAPAAHMPALAPPVLTAAPVPPPACPAPVSASSEPSETAAVAPAAPMPALAPPVLTAAPVPPPASVPAPVSASSEPSETTAVAPAACPCATSLIVSVPS